MMIQSQENHVVSRAKCGLVTRKTDSVPGVKVMAKETIWNSSADNQSIVSDYLTSDFTGSTLNQDRWSEHFQDLSGYCNTGSIMTNQQSQQLGELNTPNITVQEEFDFGLRSSSRELIRFDDSDPWQVSAPLTSTAAQQQLGLWGTVQDWLSTSSQKDIDEQEVIDLIDVNEVDPLNDPQLDAITFVDEQKPKLPLVSPECDYLLSQSHTSYKQSVSPPSQHQSMRDLKQEQSYNDLVLFQENQATGKHRSLMHQQLSAADECNSVNMNNVLNSNSNIRCELSLNQQGPTNNPFVSVQTTTLQSKFRTFDNESSNSYENRRDPVNRSVNHLSSIFKSEEPFIGDSVKQSSSLLSAGVNDDVVGMITTRETVASLAPIVISRNEMSSRSDNTSPPKRVDFINSSISQRQIKNVYSDQCNVLADESSSMEYILSDIKSEPVDVVELEVETINHRDDKSKLNVMRPNVGGKRKFKMPPLEVKKAKLKLDIDSAARLVSSAITPTLTPTTTSSIVGDTNVSLSTPDVLRPLLSANTEFNLLSYISEDATVEELANNNDGNVASSSDRCSPVVVKRKELALLKPVRRRKVKVEKVESHCQMPTLTVVKEERDSDDDKLIIDEQATSSRVLRTSSKRKRVAKRSEDMEFDIDNISELVEDQNDDDEKHDKTFELTPYRRKRTISTASRSSMASCSSRTKFSRETDSSDHESVISNLDKYRELRNRNNEASRRSRQNRKSREQDMKWQENHFEQENRRLQAKADELERLLNKLREGLMHLVREKKR